MKFPSKRVIAGAMAASLVLAACGDDDDTADVADSAVDVVDSAADEVTDEMSSEMMSSEMSDDTSEVATDLSGTIDISGSSTVEPISVRVQELFNETYPDVNITVDGPGTGDGFQLFCEGTTDISDASRAIKDEEAQACADAGVEYTEIQVGIDGIAVMTNSANEAVTCLSFEQIYGLVGPESTGFENWSDANALVTEIGGDGSLPDAPLDIYGPGEESGTFDSFIEIVLEDIADERGQEAITRPDYNPAADDNVILQGIQSSDTTFGWVGFAFADQADDVKLLEVDGGDGCVPANQDTIADNSYPISRPLFIYVNNAKAAESDALTTFVDFYLSEGLDTAVSEVDYVALADDRKEEVRQAWADAKG